MKQPTALAMVDELSLAPDHSGRAEISWLGTIPFILVHLICLAAVFTGVTWTALALCIGLYWLRIFAIGAGYHRYFAHRAFTTSRWFQFVLAILAQSSAQKSVLWWAAKHRLHHRHSDTAADVHSPRQRGFIYAHLGWIFARTSAATEMNVVSDLARHPELVWLHRLALAPAIGLGALCFLIDGWSGLVVGFFWSTVLVYHGTFSINSLAHVWGRKRYVTGDDSRNNWALAIITMGEGWHNNHHAYQSSARQGFRWWEVDLTFYALKGLQRVGLIWGLKAPPQAVRRNERRLGAKVIDRAAADLAASFNLDRLVTSLLAACSAPRLAELRTRLTESSHRPAEVIADFIATLNRPHLPTRPALVAQAKAMFPDTPSFDDIVTRSHAVLMESLGARLSALARPTV